MVDTTRKDTRGFLRGSAARARVQQEQERIRQRQEQRDKQSNKPFRYRVKQNTEENEFIVLDSEPDFFVYEHVLRDPLTGRWGPVTCCRDYTTCAVCESSDPDLKESTYNMVLTVIDLNPYTTRKGETIEFSRKLLVVKPGQQKKFNRYYEREGTLRGAVFSSARGGEKTAAIGDDIEFVEYMPEEDLLTYQREWTDREGKAHTEDCSQPFVYEECFDPADPDYLRRLAGAAPVEGSNQANADVPVPSRKQRDRAVPARPASKELEADAVFEDDDDDLPFDPDEADNPSDESDESDESDKPAPKTTRRRAVTTPAAKKEATGTRRLARRSRTDSE